VPYCCCLLYCSRKEVLIGYVYRYSMLLLLIGVRVTCASSNTCGQYFERKMVKE